VALILLLRQPRRRKPVDELEAADAALRARIVDLEDRLEHFVKRTAGRLSRESVAESPAPVVGDRAAGLLQITRAAKAMGLK
jgi:hypothetical protein